MSITLNRILDTVSAYAAVLAGIALAISFAAVGA
ncbi:MAG: hypothetical protein JWP50_758 [Phenylobacterium sp.]|nr:hypothetical protein [Phenylobacterium sp.]